MKRFTIFVSFCLMWYVSCSTIDVAINQRVDVSKKLDKIVVFPFEIRNAPWGDEFSDAVTHHLFKTGRVEVVERQELEKILKEQKLSMTGILDSDKTVKIGKLLGADVIVIGRGTALDLGNDSLEKKHLIDTFMLKVVSVETGTLLITVRKEPGIAWTWWYRLKYCCSLTLFYNRYDALLESSRYDEISRQIASRIVEALQEIEMKRQTKI
ncbi:MAG: CsgG/HfaB family protein [Spirochaetes bacterium]|nr:CsgG/HfaB family protein [Spirochaetota bacterium]